ncbi:MAG: TAXI family TRAP transporter solute-binding subunit [Alphaproteobacteria bacterium]
MRRHLSAVLVAGLVVAAGTAAHSETFVTIGTGGQTGVYYVVGQSICKLVNRGDAGIKCTAPSTGGSVANINAIKEGSMDMGVAQSDWQAYAYEGAPEFEGGKFEDLRAVFSVHGEPFTVVARNDAGIDSFDGLGASASISAIQLHGQRGTMEVIMKALGWQMTTSHPRLRAQIRRAVGGARRQQGGCDRVHRQPSQRLDPGGGEHGRRAHLVPGGRPGDRQAGRRAACYAKAVIPGSMYQGTDDDTHTFGVKATFVSSASVTTRRPTWWSRRCSTISTASGPAPRVCRPRGRGMIRDGLTAPSHPGASATTKKRGWL